MNQDKTKQVFLSYTVVQNAHTITGEFNDSFSPPYNGYTQNMCDICVSSGCSLKVFYDELIEQTNKNTAISFLNRVITKGLQLAHQDQKKVLQEHSVETVELNDHFVSTLSDDNIKNTLDEFQKDSIVPLINENISKTYFNKILKHLLIESYKNEINLKIVSIN